MNTLKIQIKPFYKNNPFHLKDDQIHILSTNKNEEETGTFSSFCCNNVDSDRCMGAIPTNIWRSQRKLYKNDD